MFVSGGEDQKMVLSMNGESKQEILHPSTLWSIAVARGNDNDIATACGDGYVRVFTKVTSRKATIDELDSFRTEGEMASVQGSEIDEKTLKSFPTIDKLATMKGKKEGEIRIFRDGGIPKAYAWQENKWNLVGDVMG